MGEFSFKLPDDKEAAIIDAWCFQEGYSEIISDENGQMIANPETKTQFAQRTVKQKMKDVYIRYQAEQARLAATIAANADDEV